MPSKGVYTGCTWIVIENVSVICDAHASWDFVRYGWVWPLTPSPTPIPTAISATSKCFLRLPFLLPLVLPVILYICICMRVVLVVRKLSYHQHCCHHQHWACTHHAAGSFSAQFCAFLVWSAETAFTATSIFSTRVMSCHDCMLADPLGRTAI